MQHAAQTHTFGVMVMRQVENTSVFFMKLSFVQIMLVVHVYTYRVWSLVFCGRMLTDVGKLTPSFSHSFPNSNK